GRGGQPPAAMESFITLNGSFNAIVSMMQVGLDMPPTPAQIDTWQADCKHYTTTLGAWKKVESTDLPAFNAALTKGGQTPLSVTPTKLTAPSCSFAAAAAPAA